MHPVRDPRPWVASAECAELLDVARRAIEAEDAVEEAKKAMETLRVHIANSMAELKRKQKELEALEKQRDEATEELEHYV